MKKMTHHLQHYLPLIGVLCAGVLGFRLFSYDKLFQEAIVVSVGVAYIAWGIIHHYIHGDLHLSVILEYVAIATLGLVLILTLVFRA
jgi:hypothetical protein